MLYIQLTSIFFGNNQEDLSMNEITLNWNEYTESAIKTAAEGIVMIENKDNVLPLRPAPVSLSSEECRSITTSPEQVPAAW